MSEADVTPPPSSPPSRCLNKSCTKSFYLHMLTGTVEKCTVKKIGLEKREWVKTLLQKVFFFFTSHIVTLI